MTISWLVPSALKLITTNGRKLKTAVELLWTGLHIAISTRQDGCPLAEASLCHCRLMSDATGLIGLQLRGRAWFS